MGSDERHDLRCAHHRRVADDRVHVVALEDPGGQCHANRRLGDGRHLRDDLNGGAGAGRGRYETSGPLAAAAVEDAHVRARSQAQHSRHVMRFAGRQGDAAGGWIERGHIDARDGHADIMSVDGLAGGSPAD